MNLTKSHTYTQTAQHSTQRVVYYLRTVTVWNRTRSFFLSFSFACLLSHLFHFLFRSITLIHCVPFFVSRARDMLHTHCQQTYCMYNIFNTILYLSRCAPVGDGFGLPFYFHIFIFFTINNLSSQLLCGCEYTRLHFFFVSFSFVNAIIPNDHFKSKYYRQGALSFYIVLYFPNPMSLFSTEDTVANVAFARF